MSGQITHEWLGTTLVITSDSGTSGCDLKGDRGDIGIRGPQGAQGEKPEVFWTLSTDGNELDLNKQDINVNGTKVLETINLHTADTNNPHGVTCEQIGADVVGSAAAVQGQLLAHIEEDNAHHVTAEMIGLGNVDNTADIDKPVSTAQQAAINEVIDSVDAINDISTGILAQAKEYTDEAVGNAGVGVVSSVNGKTGVVKLESADIEGLDDAIAAKMPKAGGTFTGVVFLGANSRISDCSTANYSMLRNMSLYSTATNPANNGCIVWQYG